LDKKQRIYQIERMKEILKKRPIKKVNRFKMRKVKKIWVFSYAVTTIFGVNIMMDYFANGHSILAYADEASSQYTPSYYYYNGNPIIISGGTIGVSMEIRVPNSLGKTIRSVTFSNGSGQRTLSSFTSPVQDSSSDSYTILTSQPPLTVNPTSQAQDSYVRNPIIFTYTDGTTSKTSIGTSDVIREMEIAIRRLQRQINSLNNFDDNYKIKTNEAYVSKANELANSYEANLLYPENDTIISPDFPDGAVLDAMLSDKKDQNTWFGELNTTVANKTTEINAITDAVPGGKEEANQKVADYLTQAKAEVFASEGTAISTKAQEWIDKINAIQVERIAATPETPTISPATEGEQEISGTGQPGDTIVITDQGGTELGMGTVGEDGSIKIATNRPLEKGEIITVTPSVGDKVGTPATVTVLPKSETGEGDTGNIGTPDSHKPTINQPTAGDQVVTGTGTPGDTIVITDQGGTELGTGTVGEDGSIKIDTNRPLEAGEVITATPSTGENIGTPATVTVLPKSETGEGDTGNIGTPDSHKPTINQPTAGDQVVTGTGTPGDTIVITDQGGTELGTGTVGEDGSIKIDTNRPLEAGEVITATPSTGENIGTPATVTVLPKSETGEGDTGNIGTPDSHKPTINQPTAGDQVNTGGEISKGKTFSKDLPKMGDEIYQSISILGILMILFSGGIFLIRKKS